MKDYKRYLRDRFELKKLKIKAKAMKQMQKIKTPRNKKSRKKQSAQRRRFHERVALLVNRIKKSLIDEERSNLLKRLFKE